MFHSTKGGFTDEKNGSSIFTASAGSSKGGVILNKKLEKELGRVNGPRCCKRDAQLALRVCVDYINSNYPVKLEYSEAACTFYPENRQCIRERCPFFPKS